MDDLFADGVSDITVINGVARLTLVSLEAAREGRETGDAKPVPISQHRLVMPVAGLINAVQQAQALIARLEKAGVLQRQAPGVAPDDAKPVTATSKSPNF